jgi:hypothetical protein
MASAPEGLELHWESVPERAATRPTDLPRGGALTALGRLPSDTLAAVGGDSLPTLLNGVDDVINQMMGGSGPFAPRIQFQFTRWLGGEFAAGMGPGSLRLNASGGTTGQADLVLAARVKDTTAAQTDVGALDRLLFAKPAQVGGVPMKQLGTGASSAYYGLSDDWLYLLSGERPERLVAPKLGFTDSLTTTPHYALVKRALRDDAVVFYLDLEDGRRLMETMLPPAQQTSYEKSRVLLQPFRALGANFRTDPNGDVHGTILLAISG